jgi:hypothetical protein
MTLEQIIDKLNDPTLTSINLKPEIIDAEDAQAIANVLKHNTTLTTIILGKVGTNLNHYSIPGNGGLEHELIVLA